MPMTVVDRDTIMLMFAMTECRRALDSLAAVDHLANKRIIIQPGVEVRENLRVFDSIRLGLQMAANVSRLFWPPRNQPRGARLRSLIGLPFDHGLSDRSLRNHIEHLDERLDAWTANSPRPFLAIEHVMYEDYLGSDQQREEIIDATAIIYDCQSQSVQLFGSIFSLTRIRNDLEDVLSKISTADW